MGGDKHPPNPRLIKRVLQVLESVTSDLDEDCKEPGCPDCESWRSVWAVMEELRAALHVGQR